MCLLLSLIFKQPGSINPDISLKFIVKILQSSNLPCFLPRFWLRELVLIHSDENGLLINVAELTFNRFVVFVHCLSEPALSSFLASLASLFHSSFMLTLPCSAFSLVLVQRHLYAIYIEM